MKDNQTELACIRHDTDIKITLACENDEESDWNFLVMVIEDGDKTGQFMFENAGEAEAFFLMCVQQARELRN